MLYNYWQIYYKPSPLNGDRVTVGIVVVNPDQPADFAIRTVENHASIADIGGPREAFITLLKKTEKNLKKKYWQQELQLSEAPSNLAQYIEFMKSHSHGIMQFGEKNLAAGDSAQDLADFLFRNMVRELQPVHRVHRHKRLADSALDIISDFPALRERIITQPRLVLDDYRESLHFAVVDDGRDSALELTEGFSFNVNIDSAFKQRMLAWTFLIQMLREKGGSLEKARENEIFVPNDAVVTALVEYPRSSQQYKFFSALERNWKDLGVEIWTLESYQAHARDLNDQFV